MSKEQRQNSLIKTITCRQVFDSHGQPAVEVEILTGDGCFRSIAPDQMGGQFEPKYTREGGFNGKGVEKCLEYIQNELVHPLLGISVQDQSSIDALLAEIDGSPRFDKFGVNCVLPISQACCLANAANQRCPLWKTIAKMADTRKCALPVPLVSIFAGGSAFQNVLPFYDIQIAPVGATSFFEAMKLVDEIQIDFIKTYQIKQFGQEGNLLLKQKTIEDYLDILNNQIKNIGMEGKIGICIDCKAGDFCAKSEKQLPKYELGNSLQKPTMTGTELADFYVQLMQAYPILSLQDPFDYEDVDSFKYLRLQMDKLQIKAQIFGDDIVQSQIDRLSILQTQRAINGATLRLQQCGTVTQAINMFKSIQAVNYKALVSGGVHECVDAFAAHFAVGVSSELVRFGGLGAGERICKYNELMRIEECGEVVYGCQDWILQ
uniref:phosphopyruvate hydratase n=1 Tax=Trepomonas sp. PC1 TaxID=1076344 RepID=A0A146KL04_9EUKA|eukprot:JAP95899.1 Enolase [Trepomonas sp. PC1]